MAIAPGDMRLLVFANNWLDARRESGWLSALGTRWFDGHSWLRALEGDPARPAGTR
jgi:ABC-type amino acid transport substrate-binding protein